MKRQFILAALLCATNIIHAAATDSRFAAIAKKMPHCLHPGVSRAVHTPDMSSMKRVRDITSQAETGAQLTDPTPYVTLMGNSFLPQATSFAPTISMAANATSVARAVMPAYQPDGTWADYGEIQVYDCSEINTPLFQQGVQTAWPLQVVFNAAGQLCWLAGERSNGSELDSIIVSRPSGEVNLPNMQALSGAVIDNDANWLVVSDEESGLKINLYNLNDTTLTPQILLAQKGIEDFAVALTDNGQAPSVAMVSSKRALLWQNGGITTVVQGQEDDVPHDILYGYDAGIFSPDGKRLYIIANNFIWVYDLETHICMPFRYDSLESASHSPLPVASQARRIAAIDPTGNRLAVKDPRDGLLIIDTQTMQVMGNSYYELGSTPSVAPSNTIAMSFGPNSIFVNAITPWNATAVNPPTVDSINTVIISQPAGTDDEGSVGAAREKLQAAAAAALPSAQEEGQDDAASLQAPQGSASSCILI